MTRKPSGSADGKSSESGTTPDLAKKEKAMNTTHEDLRSSPGLESASEARIGMKLKAMYDEVLNEPVPDRLMDLLGQLDEKTKDNG